MLFYVVLGGMVGAISRFAISKVMNKKIPIGTFFINILGSFFLGYFFSLGISDHIYALIGTGFCGAFTTFSTMNLESFLLFKKSRKVFSLVYIFLSYLFGILFAFGGFLLGK
jgi:fluoride exporter